MVEIVRWCDCCHKKVLKEEPLVRAHFQVQHPVNMIASDKTIDICATCWDKFASLWNGWK